MNEEEKKAIEDMNRFANGIDMSCVTARQMQIILNLIEKKKICINILDDELKERDETINKKEIIIEKLQKENEELKKNYINAQNSANMAFCKVTPPPEPQLPTKTLCESFSKRNKSK